MNKKQKISIRIDLEFRYNDKKTARICFNEINKTLKIAMDKSNGFHIEENSTQLNDKNYLFLSKKETKQIKKLCHQ